VCIFKTLFCDVGRVSGTILIIGVSRITRKEEEENETEKGNFEIAGLGILNDHHQQGIRKQQLIIHSGGVLSSGVRDSHTLVIRDRMPLYNT
jgi:hypothetical protein